MDGSRKANVKRTGPSPLPRREPISGSDERADAPDRGRHLEGIDGTGSDLSRLYSLSDGVFAFALTFLAITILLPQAGTGGSLPALTAYLRRLEPSFVAYVLSFFVIAAWWGVHHRLFSCLVRYDQTIVRLNTFFLLLISVTPFLVSLLFAYGPGGFGPSSESARIAVALYAGLQMLGGVDLLLVWRYATRSRRLVARSLPEEWVRTTEQNQLVTVGVFAASVGVAFVSPLVAELTWLVMVLGPGRRIWRRRPRPRKGEAPT
ncbi:MAG TPA: TMEM175 family protein [Thermoplasmata archaeon]|nr:TMEM175 family protein [Thermoplasmata archaeon]